MNHTPEEFVTYVIQSLVDNVEDVKVTRTVDDMGVLLTVDLHPDDMGKIIGRKGSTAKAIRTLARVNGMANNARVNIKINEPARADGGSSSPSSEMDAAIDDLKTDI
ncbi:MAG: KH domain-containing protein [Candidatus Nomurabacteria bacterium]|nr:KH domain-containing protein [Candidatus Nomurabacteria bacterium]